MGLRRAGMVVAGSVALGSACALSTDFSGLSGGVEDAGSETSADGPLPPPADADVDHATDAGSDAATSAYVAAVLADAPLAYWRLGDAPSASTAADRVGVHPGTYVGPSTRGVAGAIAGDPDTATSFDATGYVELGDVLDVTGGDFTLEAWFTSPAFGNGLIYEERYLFSKFARPTLAGYHAYVSKEFADDAGTHPARLGLDLCAGGACDELNLDMPLPQTTFRHAVWTRKGTTLVVYVDGVAAAQMTSTVVAVAPGSSLRLGGDAVRTPFAGVIDEVAFYDHALTPTRIAAHYAAAH